MKNKNKGFTLIELLVVIAIIGILSSVVLASLNSARAKGADAAIKANLVNARAEAELYAELNQNKYASSVTPTVNVCNATGVNVIGDNRQAALDAGSTSVVCNASQDAWAMSALLKSTSVYWCVDSTGASKEGASALGGATVCS